MTAKKTIILKPLQQGKNIKKRTVLHLKRLKRYYNQMQFEQTCLYILGTVVISDYEVGN